jgi:hypothetical protein
MECWSRCSTYESAMKADKLFAELKELYEKSEHNLPGGQSEGARVQPSAYTYTTLIKAWSRAAATSGSVAPQRAEAILEELLTVSLQNPEKQQQQQQQQQNYHSNANFLVIPNAVPFTAVLQCWAQSKDVPNKATKALELLKRMKSLAVSTNNPALLPTLATYNAAIDVCATTQAASSSMSLEMSAKLQLASLKIAIAILKAIEVEGQKHNLTNELPMIQPNSVTYGKLLRAIGSLLPPGAERNQIAKAIFQKAITAGQVDMSVIRNLQKAADISILHELLPTTGSNTLPNSSATSTTNNENERDKIESRILQRNKGVALNTRRNTSSKGGGKQFINPDSIPNEWSKNVRNQ